MFSRLFLMLLAFYVVAFLSGGTEAKRRTDEEAKKGARAAKFLNLFQVVTFPNDSCNGGTKNGTCYTSTECSSRSGTNAGSCAAGFGVCCTFTLNCGATSSENCTYFDSNSVTSGACSVTICPCNNNICQLRLDFVSFSITGPSTVSTSALTDPQGDAVSLASQCLTDTFSVTNPGGPAVPTICGVNTGDHMYVESDVGCNVLAFQLGNTAMGSGGIGTRAWSIKISQYSCDYPNLAPAGCTQYYFGSSTGTIQSFNYDGGQHLANQDQTICIRQETGNCRICFYATTSTDFMLSGTTGAGSFSTGTVCCSYGTPAKSATTRTMGFDCVNIPDASGTNGVKQINSNLCGRAFPGTVCTQTTPFVIRFTSDAWEYAIAVKAAMAEAGNMDLGFQLTYVMDSTNCQTTG